MTARALCGTVNPAQAHAWHEREALIAVKDNICRICRDVYATWPDWDTDPISLMSNLCEQSDKRGDDRRALSVDLRSLAALAQQYPEDFQRFQTLHALGTGSLHIRRRRR